MRDERVARIAGQENNPGAATFGRGNKIFAAQFIPAVRLGSLLEAIVRINDPRNASISILLGFERERVIVTPAKVSAEKSPHPGPAAFRYRNHDGVTA